MKNKITLKIFVVMSFLALTTTIFAQKAPKNAKDFFAELPAEYMTGTKVQRLGTKEKPGYLSTFTPKPDHVKFLLFENEVPQLVKGSFKTPQSLGGLKLYRGKTSTIIGLSFQVSDKDEVNPTPDTVAWHTFLLEYKDGKWANVTNNLMPKVTIDDAYKAYTEDLQLKNIDKKDIRVEAQFSEDDNTLMMVAKRKGDDSVTTLKSYKWTGSSFVKQD